MKLLDNSLCEEMHAKAVVSPRKRVHHNLHSDLDDPVQRLAVVMEPGTYIRPHRHTRPEKWELFVALRGAATVFIFADDGRVLKRQEIGAAGPCQAIEIPAKAWHTLVINEPATFLLEVKPGPYAPLPESDFASWAPSEGVPEAGVLESWLHGAKVGAQAAEYNGGK